MSSQLFGTDGIRGPAGTYPLDDAGMLQIGKAVGDYFAMPGETVLVGWDPRESSPKLMEPLVKGLAGMGAEVRKVGVIPTPGLAYLTKQQGARAGLIITASHNPYTDNGVKIFTPDGRKLSDKDQAGLNQRIDDQITDRAGGRIIEDPDAAKAYEDFLVESAGGKKFDTLQLAVDMANGATSGVAARAFERLGAKVTTLSDKPDGRNINVECGATDTRALQQAVKSQSLDAGAAFDGDGDRVMLVDAQGRELNGDYILYILAMAGKQKGVVATIMSNQGLETALKEAGIGFSRTAVGDRSVLQGLDDTGFQLGGEQSGHIIISEYAATGDGILAAIRTLAAVLESKESLAEWRDKLQLVPQALVNIAFPDKSLLDREDIQAFIRAQTEDLGAKGRLSIRPSGTEPKVRVMVEAADAESRAKAIADQLTHLASSKN
jgi:phosphoglucosamine mutase